MTCLVTGFQLSRCGPCCLFVWLTLILSFDVCLFVCLFIYLFIYLFVYLFVFYRYIFYLFVCLLSLCANSLPEFNWTLVTFYGFVVHWTLVTFWAWNIVEWRTRLVTVFGCHPLDRKYF